MKIDSHHHIWNIRERPQTWMTPGQAARIGRNFTLEDWRAAAVPAGITHSVLVQTVEDPEETVDLLRLADESASVLGVVGWVEYGARNVQEQISRLFDCQGADKLVSLRDLTEYREETDWIEGREAGRVFAVAGKLGIAADLLIKQKNLPSAANAIRSHPETRFIVNHLAKPELDRTSPADWGRGMRSIADLPNAALKLSGLATLTANFQSVPTHVHEYIEEALNLFSADRVMFGSDWPVSLLGATYSELVTTIEDALQLLSDNEAAAVWSGTACRWYGLATEGPQ